MPAVADTTSGCIVSSLTDSTMPQHTSSGSNTLYTAMPANSHSPVPSLTHEASRASSASSSVTSLSPGALAVATPRDLMPQFSSPLDNPSGDAKQMPLVTRHHNHHHHKSADVADNTNLDSVGLKRRASSQDDIPDTAAATATATASPTSKRRRTISRRRNDQSPRPPKRLTGSADFVKRFGLVDLYDQFVRPYVVPAAAGPSVRQQMPDLASAYLRNVHGATVATTAGPSSRPLDLMALVMAPPKNEFERLDLLPMASIKAAFSISRGSGASDSSAPASKRSRISLKYSTDSPQHHQQQQHSSAARRESSNMSHRKQDVSSSASANGPRRDHHGHGGSSSGRQHQHSSRPATTSPNRA